MVNQKIIIYPPTLDWTFMFQRPQQIMRQFAQNGYRVIYCNATQRPGVPPSIVEPNIEVHHDWERVKRDYKRPDILWISWAKHYDIPIEAKVTIYDCLDDFPDWDKFEPAMLSRSNIVFTTSDILYNKQKNKHANVVICKNACDTLMIGSRNYPPPQDLVTLRKPIVGFIGAIGSWVDVDLLNRIAQSFNLVVIGPNFGKSAPPTAKYLGIEDYKQLPAYYANIDVGIIPFLINRVSVAANPIKMFEYLAAGKPVVATDLPECDYPGVVYRSKNYVEFISNIHKAYQSNVSAEARQIAIQNTWECRFATIENEINKIL
jgi:glycosyltransferase involved in cell wall biosynthesis